MVVSSLSHSQRRRVLLRRGPAELLVLIMIHWHLVDGIQYKLDGMRRPWQPLHDTRGGRDGRCRCIAVIHEIRISAGQRTNSTQVIRVVIVTGQRIHLGVVNGSERRVDNQQCCAHL